MALNRVLSIYCKCEELTLINVYNYLYALLRKDNPLADTSLSSGSDHLSLSYKAIPPTEFSHEKKSFLSTLLELSRDGTPLSCLDSDLSNTAIILELNATILGSDAEKSKNEEDIIIYRHLFMITHLLMREQDYAVIHCYKGYYYHIKSYFSLEGQLHNKCAAVFADAESLSIKGTPIFFDSSVPFSKEWVPAIFLGNNIPTYRALANPIIESPETLNKIIKNKDKYFKKSGNRVLPVFENIQGEPKAFFTLWICYQYRHWVHIDLENKINNKGTDFYSLIDKFCNISGITQILFAMLMNLHFGNAPLNKKADLEKVNELFSWCCDLGDCILQIAENVITHTEGGILSIRSNENWSSIENYFRLKNEAGTTRQEKKRYVRVSLIDASHHSILDNIHNLKCCENVTYKGVFDSKELTAYQEQHLGNPNEIIHHYGLMVYRLIVESLKGCFTLFSSAKETVDPTEDSYISEYDDIEIISTRAVQKPFSHIPGSEYDAIFRLRTDLMPQKTVASAIISPKYISRYPDAEPVFDPDLVTFFNNSLDQMILELRTELLADKSSRPGDNQRLKEKTINAASDRLIQLISFPKYVDHRNPVWYFYLRPYKQDSEKTPKTYYGRTEITAKILMRVIAAFSQSENGIKIVLYGMTENQLISFVRQFALFYHTTKGNPYIGKNQLYVISEDYRTDILFAGDKLRDISNFASQRKLITGATPRIETALSHIARRDSSESGGSAFEPFPFELLKRMEYSEKRTDENTKDSLILSANKCWYYDTLDTVLDTDLHGKSLGCKLDGIHIQVGKLHNKCFYEAHLLFSNAYWYQVFAAFICEKVLEFSPTPKKKRILLYGYETYSEQMLRAARKKLVDMGYNVSYVIFENSRPGLVSNSSLERIRYIDEFCESVSGEKTEKEELLIVYIMGISQTQVTLDQMKSAISKKLSKKIHQEEKRLIMMQFVPKFDTASVNLFQPKDKYLLWKRIDSYKSWGCPLCFPENNEKGETDSYIHERPLIMTNEASIIPMMLIRPEEHNPIPLHFQIENEYEKHFLDDEGQDNHKYLYYTHMSRGGNHYEYYLRTAQIVHDMDLNKNSDLRKWFAEIKKKENEDADRNNNRINIIVAPMHFSNEVFSSAVNEYVFDSSAYFINFDVRQEFRESFIAKFQNFCAAIDNLVQEKRLHNIELNFYYVDDDINTGSTFQRAKSLVSSLLKQYLVLQEGDNSEVKVSVFKAIIILTTRNSRSTFLPYFELSSLRRENDQSITLPVYCFLELKTPSIRSAGLMCPLCRKVERIKHLITESSLTFVERHWREKYSYHQLKQLHEAKADREKMNRDHPDSFFPRRGFRRLQCSELLWDVLKSNQYPKDLYNELTKRIQETVAGKNSYEEKVEYLISFLKVISREDIVYREGANDAAMRIILSIFSLFLRDGKAEKEAKTLYETVRDLLFKQQDGIRANDSKPLFRSENPTLIYQLFQIIIARFCTMGSNVLLDEKRLGACINTGIDLQILTGEKDDGGFLEFLCWQIKKNLASVGDKEVRVEKMNAILRSCIEKEMERDSQPCNQENQKANYLKPLDYYFALFLESVSDDTKKVFLQHKIGKNHRSILPHTRPSKLTDYEKKVYESHEIQSAEETIKKQPYKIILQEFCQFMKAQTAYMFQARDGKSLVGDSKITILDRSNANVSDRPIQILRSELRDFYMNVRGDSRFWDSKLPSSHLVCKIKDTLKLVLVEETQQDIAVGEYRRQPCLIAYIRLDYKDENDQSGDSQRHIFFAFLYTYDNYRDFRHMYSYGHDLPSKIILILEMIRGFLSFRYSLVNRIEKDFKGNLYGEKADAQWRQNMLSTDRAGCHLDDSALSRLIKSTDFETDEAIKVLFLYDQQQGDRKDTYDLIYNNLIAMYYRKAISDDKKPLGLDNVENDSYHYLHHLIDLQYIAKPKLNFPTSVLLSDLEEAELSCRKPTLPKPKNKKKSIGSGSMIEKKYLRAFLIDVFSNVVRHGPAVANISVEECDDASDFLVVSNKVEPQDENDVLSKNYDLKGALELDYMDLTEKHGISLGSFASLLDAHNRHLKACYSIKNGEKHFCIKIPIIKIKKD